MGRYLGKNKVVCLGYIVSIVCLYFSLRGLNLRELWSNIREIGSYFMLWGGVFIVVEFVLRAVRWKILLRPVSSAKLNEVFSVLMIGYFSNNVIPLRMGELVRAQFLGRSCNINRVQAFATIVVERLCDVLMLVSLFGACLIVSYPFPAWIQQGGLLAGIVLVASVSGLCVFCSAKSGLAGVVSALLKHSRTSKAASSVLESFGTGLTVLSEVKTVGAALCMSLLIWGTTIAFINTMFLAFSLDLSPFAAVLVVVMLGLGMLIPASPGYIGVYEACVILALVPFGVGRELGLSIAVVLHFMQLAISSSIGFVCLVRQVGLGVGGLLKLGPERVE